jgi:MEMO1 family protein
MSIVFAAITPHPPLIIPGVGKDEDKINVKNTIDAMNDLSAMIADSDPDTIIIISPHAMVHPDKFAVYGSPKFYGDFEHFGASDVSFSINNNVEFANKIVEKSKENGINAFLFGDPDSDYTELDHGEMVPLYYLMKNLPENIQTIPIAYSYLDRLQHFGFGEIINEVSKLPEFKDNRIAVIASGDLSHRLFQKTSENYYPGKDFDNELVSLIKENKSREILEMDQNLIDEAGECGFRSILILLGTLDKLHHTPNIISYEGPYGVGYLVANYDFDNIIVE